MTQEREGRGRTVVRDPSEAVAMAKCWMSTWKISGKVYGLPLNSFHEKECGYCEVPREVLIKAVTEFMEWSNISSYAEGLPLRLEIESWESLPHDEQARLVAKAAGLITEEREVPDDPRSPW